MNLNGKNGAHPFHMEQLQEQHERRLARMNAAARQSDWKVIAGVLAAILGWLLLQQMVFENLKPEVQRHILANEQVDTE
jgi:hypothetical protein